MEHKRAQTEMYFRRPREEGSGIETRSAFLPERHTMVSQASSFEEMSEFVEHAKFVRKNVALAQKQIIALEKWLNDTVLRHSQRQFHPDERQTACYDPEDVDKINQCIGALQKKINVLTKNFDLQNHKDAIARMNYMIQKRSEDLSALEEECGILTSDPSFKDHWVLKAKSMIKVLDDTKKELAINLKEFQTRASRGEF